MTLITNALALSTLVSLAIIATAYAVNYYPRARAFTAVTTLLFVAVFLSIIAGAVLLSAKVPELSTAILASSLLSLWMGNQKIWRPEPRGNADAEQMSLRR